MVNKGARLVVGRAPNSLSTNDLRTRARRAAVTR